MCDSTIVILGMGRAWVDCTCGSSTISIDRIYTYTWSRRTICLATNKEGSTTLTWNWPLAQRWTRGNAKPRYIVTRKIRSSIKNSNFQSATTSSRTRRFFCRQLTRALFNNRPVSRGREKWKINTLTNNARNDRTGIESCERILELFYINTLASFSIAE